MAGRAVSDTGKESADGGYDVGLITDDLEKHLPELLGMFMEIQRKKFGGKEEKV